MAATFTIPNYPDASSKVMKIGEYWYDELSNEVLTFRTMLHPVLSGTNYKIIYPEVSKFHTDNPSLNLMYPRNDGLYQTLSGYSFLGTGQQINIVQVDTPFVSYNKQTKAFVVTFLGRDIGGYRYLFTYYLKRKEEELIAHNIDVVKPDLDILNITFTDWERLSGEYNYTEVIKPLYKGDLINFENALTASYGIETDALSSLSSCQTVLQSNTANEPYDSYYQGTTGSEFSTGQLGAFYAEPRNDGMNTLFLGCSSVEYIPGNFYPFPVMYNTTYALPQQTFNINSDIEVFVELATYAPQLGLSNRAVYSAPKDGWQHSADAERLSGSWGTFLTAFSAENTSGLDSSYLPGNGFCIFFYNPEGDEFIKTETVRLSTGVWPEERFHPYNDSVSGLSAYNYPLSGFRPGGVGESLGWKPYSGLIQLTAGTGIPLTACPTLESQGQQSGHLAVGFDTAGGFAALSALPPEEPGSGGPGITGDPGSNTITIAAGEWDQYRDYVVTPQLHQLENYADYAHLPNRNICQSLTGIRESTLQFPMYRVTLEDCGRTVRVAIKHHSPVNDVSSPGTIRPPKDKYVEYASYTIPSSANNAWLTSLSSVKVGFAWTTSDKTMTCEIRSINTYGRDVKNQVYRTDCGTHCAPETFSLSSTDVCPVSVDYNYLRAESDFSPILTEGHPLSTFGLNYIVDDETHSMYYNVNLNDPQRP